MKARSCRNAAGDSLLVRREVIGLAARDIKLREDAEDAMDRNCPVRLGARRARQRAIAGGQAAGELCSSKDTLRIEDKGVERAKEGSLEGQ